jgi:hypothetical protein
MHDIKALVSSTEALRNATNGLATAVICPLVQGLSLLPITDSLRKELSALPSTVENLQTTPLPELFDRLHELALKVSSESPVVYVSTQYFGGTGGRDALAWVNGSLVFGPTTPGYDQVWPNSSISQALRAIGVSADANKDEFDTIGLGNHRETHKWAAAHTRA